MTAVPEPDERSMTYEQLVEALEQLTQRLADGDVGIEEAVELYERAGHLHALAAERLARVQERVDRLAAEEESLQGRGEDRSV
ncbi:MAG TPA: exodeoxyribonuclease VII small subunit [Acidimicrobiales bacterium]|nr:exodeoxyribonuclease VII small subunit [Acidimicrobiales bacterium]